MLNNRLIAVTLTSQADAEAVRDALLKLSQQHTHVSVGDYLDLVGVSSTFADQKIGWSDLKEIPIGKVGEDEFVLDLPDPQMLNPTLSEKLLQERKDGLSETQIAEKHNLTTSEIRMLITTARLERHMSLTEEVRTLAKTPMSNVQIAQELGLTESEVRLLLKGE